MKATDASLDDSLPRNENFLAFSFMESTVFCHETCDKYFLFDLLEALSQYEIT